MTAAAKKKPAEPKHAGLMVKRYRVADLSMDPANARKHDERNIESIMASLRRFGQQTPIVVDISGVVRKGNGTLEAAKRLGWTEIECVETELKGSEATAYAVADNKTSDLSTFDDSVLAATLESLREESEELFASTGFEDKELDQLLSQLQASNGVTEDEVPEPPADPVTKPGDVWVLGEHKIICGDSTKAETWERLKIGTGFACFTSPPYNLGKAVNISGRGKQGSAYLNTADQMTSEQCKALWSDSLSLALKHCEAAVFNVQPLSATKTTAVEWLEKFKSHIAEIVIWDKGHGQPAMAEGVCNSRYEWMVVFSAKTGASRRVPLSSWRGTVDNVYSGPPRKANEFWKIHAATFPVHLPEFVIGTMMNLGRGFVDCFGGTGTTLIAAEQLGRRAYLIELEPAYCDVALERYVKLTGRIPTLESTGAPFIVKGAP